MSQSPPMASALWSIPSSPLLPLHPPRCLPNSSLRLSSLIRSPPPLRLRSPLRLPLRSSGEPDVPEEAKMVPEKEEEEESPTSDEATAATTEEIKRRLAEARAAGGGGFWSGVGEEIREIEWPPFGKVLGTTGVVLSVIAGSSVALLTVNAILAELSDRAFAGKGVQDFF